MLRTTRKCLGEKSRNVVQMRFKTDQLQELEEKENSAGEEQPHNQTGRW